MIFAVFDTETTGLTKHELAGLDVQPRCIEFAGILTDGDEILSQIEFIVDPCVKLEPIITKITGLTDDDLVGRPMFREQLPEIEEYFRQADCVISHNLHFDRQIVMTEAWRAGSSLTVLGWPVMEVCSVEQLFPLYGKRVKLVDAYTAAFGEHEQTHRAIGDVMMLHKVCQHYGIYSAIKKRGVV